MSITVIALRYRPDLRDPAAEWFHQKWGVPLQAYLDSMNACLAGAGVPQWYLALEEDRIVGGCGVIENDFHNRPDLTPNVCAVYVEEDCRRRGIAGELLNAACTDMAEAGIRTLYLLTDHEGFYERYGWRYLCPALGDGEETPSRMYIHRQPLVLHGSAPDRLQLQRLCRREQPAGWLRGLVWVLWVILWFSALRIAARVGEGLPLLALGAGAVSLGLGLFASSRAGAARRKAEEREWLLSQAALSGGATARVYPDRVEQRSSCWGETLPLDGEARVTEYRDLLVLERGEKRILLRGADLTSAQGEEAAGMIRAALPPENRFRAEPFTGSRLSPAPAPFKTDTPLCFEQVTGTYRPPAPDLLGMGAAALAVCLLFAAMLTALYGITPWVLADFLIFFGAAAAGAAGLLALFLRLLKKQMPSPVTLSFTAGGLGVTKGDGHRFVGPAQVRAVRTGDGARLDTPAGVFVFRWTDVKNRQQIEYMLFH